MLDSTRSHLDELLNLQRNKDLEEMTPWEMVLDSETHAQPGSPTGVFLEKACMAKNTALIATSLAALSEAIDTASRLNEASSKELRAGLSNLTERLHSAHTILNRATWFIGIWTLVVALATVALVLAEVLKR